MLDVDRQSYRPPADLARWLEVRDGTCRFPGCNRAARRSDIDHTIDWNDDGCTAHDNLAHVCAAHHHLKHETAWSVRHLGNGTLEWTSPAGHTSLTDPANPIPDPIPDSIPIPDVAPISGLAPSPESPHQGDVLRPPF
ncbi:HNH endonuclease signature motif containing protein [Agromyces humatus]|uniref:HNH nuclease domain-containing protein n=1 Tax=Agromyces humatus TaxID=279573 RepID=A0ABP4WV21_9MICO|nr:HNH endonuclease signature motif containing protein [Agromyces humatus]